MSEESKILDTRPQGDIAAITRPAWWTEIAVGKNGSAVSVASSLQWLLERRRECRPARRYAAQSFRPRLRGR